MVTELPVDSLSQRWPGRQRHLITRISFEERSLVVAKALAGRRRVLCTAFVSARRSEAAETNLNEFRRAFPAAQIHELDTSKALETANSLYTAVRDEAEATGLRDAVIDVTSFRREELLMLLAILRLLISRGSTDSEVVYVGATKMADWMSAQVTGYRSVIGYAGEMWPSRPTRLVILMGFEFSRARSIIDNYEPKTLVLGKGSLSESITPELAQKNDEFYRELHSQYDNVEATFEFSARDPVRVAEELEQAVPLDSSSNLIIAPLNTKLSTIGAGLFAQRHKEVQICYAPVEAYNEKAYSMPGAKAFVLPLDALL